MKLYRWVCHIKTQLKNYFRLSWTVKSLPTLRNLEVLKCIIMHSLWQLAETGSSIGYHQVTSLPSSVNLVRVSDRHLVVDIAGSRSLSSVSIIHVLQVHSWSRQEVWSAILDATEFQKLQKYCRKYCRNARFLEKRYFSFSSYSIILKFLLEKLGI